MKMKFKNFVQLQGVTGVVYTILAIVAILGWAVIETVIWLIKVILL